MKSNANVLRNDKLTSLSIRDKDIEETVLYCLVNSEECRNDLNLMDRDDFYFNNHRKLFADLKEYLANNKDADVHTLPDHIKNNKTLISLFGSKENILFTRWNNYLEKLKEVSARRKMQKLAYDMNSKLLEGRDIVRTKHYLTENLDNIEFSGIRKMSKQNKDIEEEFLAMVEGEDFGEIKTGFPTFDNKTGGFYPGEFYLIGGVPGVGKSTLLLNMTRNICNAGYKVLFVSLEMPYVSVQAKLVSDLSEVSTAKIRKSKLSTEEYQRVFRACAEIEEYKLYRLGEGGVSVLDIENEIKNLEEEIDIVFVDYLQKVRPVSGVNRYEKVSQTSALLKSLATKFKIPVVAAASLNRANVGREDKRPILSDIRDSGNIEYDLDASYFLHRESQYYDDANKDEAELIVKKARYDGSQYTVKLIWTPESSRFREMYIQEGGE